MDLRRGLILATLTAGLFGLAGCGYALVSGLGVAVATNRGGGGGSGGGATQVSAAVVSGTTGVIALEFTLADPESDAVPIEVRASTDPNEDASKTFPRVATGTIVRASDNAPVTGLVPTAPSGILYRFLWDTAADVGTLRFDAARLQVLLVGNAAFTTATFVVDNTNVPLVVSALPGTLPSGASVFADEQNASPQNPPGFVPVPVTFADAESSPVSVAVRFSTDNGLTFPQVNVAAGQFVNAAGASVAPDALPTSPSGIPYTFRFQSAANGLGTSGPQGVVLRFFVKDTRDGAPRDTPAFTVNNAAFGASPTTPSGSQVTDKVVLPFQLTDSANPSQGLDVTVQYSLAGGAAGSFANATPVAQPPAPPQGTVGLAANATGTPQAFVWNAFHDMVVAPPAPTFQASNVVLQVLVTRPSTRVTHGPFQTLFVSIDHRLIHTVLGRSPGVVRDGIPATAEPLVAPADIVFASGKVFVGDAATNRVRVIDLSTGLIDTILGGGSRIDDGALAKDVRLDIGVLGDGPRGLAVSTKGFGALYCPTRVAGVPGSRILQVDLATPPTVRTVVTEPAEDVIALAYDPLADRVYYLLRSPRVVKSFPATDPTNVTIVAGGGATPVSDAGTISPPTNASLDVEGLAVNGNAPGFDGVLMLTQRFQGVNRVIAVNTAATPRTVGGVLVPASSLRTILPTTSPFVGGDPLGISIRDDGVVLYSSHLGCRIFGLMPSGAVASLAGTGALDVSGDGGPATAARIGVPEGVGATTGTGFVLADVTNRRVREVLASGTIRTIAGLEGGDQGDGQPSQVARVSALLGVNMIGSDVIAFERRPRRFDRATTITSTVQIPNLFANGVGVGEDLYFSSLLGHVLKRRAANGVVTLLAGVEDTPGLTLTPTLGTSALLLSPQTVAFAGQCAAVAQVRSLVSAVNVGAVATTCCGVNIAPSFLAPIAGDPTLPAPVVPTNGASARAVSFLRPIGIAMNKGGDLYIADQGWSAVFRVDANAGTVTVIAGTPGTPGAAGDGGPATAALVNRPSGVTLERDLERVLYIRDSGNQKIRAVNVSAAPVTVHGITIAPGAIATVAGNGLSGSGGDGGPALLAPLSLGALTGHQLTTDDQGTLFFATDPNATRSLDKLGILRTYSAFVGPDGDDGAADNATLSRPSAIAAAPDGTYAVADLGRVRLVSPQTTTVTRRAGVAQQMTTGDGGRALDAAFDYVFTPSPPADAVLDANGPRQLAFSGTGLVTSLLAVADTRGNLVRLVNTGSVAYAGTALVLNPGDVKSVGPPFATPEGVAFTGSGLLLVAETGADRILGINLAATPVTYAGVAVAPGATAVILAGLDRPRNIALDPRTGGLVFQQGGAVITSRISALNSDPSPVTAYGQTIAPGATVRIDTGIVGPTDEPRGVAVDPSNGDAYFAVRAGDALSTAKHSVFRIRFAGGLNERVAGRGTGESGFAGDEGIATGALLDSPTGVAVDGKGMLYILDARNMRVRRCRQP